ncbi:MAG TPA: hypothetical protein VNY36_00790, partial [Bacteroidia bacterium]|nr:hypothetical protein [Bacteroidia bacterium]
MKKTLPLAFFIFLCAIGLKAQTVSKHNKVPAIPASSDFNSTGTKRTSAAVCKAKDIKWKTNPENLPGNLKAFQENQGQFINTYNSWKVLYGCDYQGTRMLFTDKGVIYILPKEVKVDSLQANNTKNRQEEEEEKQKTQMVYYPVIINWENASEKLTVEPMGQRPYYFGSMDPINPGKSIDHIKGFEKLVYHDVYPGIDIEYTFHPTQGIKYAVKVKAGYNADAFKMLYSGQQKLSQDTKGDIHITTPLGDIIDHAPISYQGGIGIQSAFKKVSDNEVAFELDKTDASQDILIDPWTVSPTTGGFIPVDIAMDPANNTYIMGGPNTSHEIYEQQYSPGGALVWTYHFTQYSNYVYYISDLAVDNAGNSYVPAPYSYSNASGQQYAMVSLNSG